MAISEGPTTDAKFTAQSQFCGRKTQIQQRLWLMDTFFLYQQLIQNG